MTVLRRKKMSEQQILLKKKIKEHHGLIFQQDNAKPHTTRVAMSCFRSLKHFLGQPDHQINRAYLRYDGKIWEYLKRTVCMTSYQKAVGDCKNVSPESPSFNASDAAMTRD
ncbi:hypothetical protein TNCV_5116491 [Trichonephila clavipes]|nr:hypothetical protein TNCV_5116491 [Trichonephila clavipes]